MATHKMTIDEWGKQIASLDKRSTKYKQIMGLSPGGAASYLNITRQMLHKLIKQGKLDKIDCVDSTGHLVATLVSDYSIAKYAKERRGFEQFKKAQ